MPCSETFIVVNPAAGFWKTAKRWKKIKKFADRIIKNFSFQFTERPLHAVEIVRSAVEKGFRKIVSVGGDGTFNEVVNGLFSKSGLTCEECCVSEIPSGTGRDFMRNFSKKLSLRKAVERVVGGEERFIDIGRAEFVSFDGSEGVRFFANEVSFGLGGLVDRIMNTGWRKRFGGKVGYFSGVLKALWEYKPKSVVLKVDNEIVFEGKVMVGVVSNGGYFGGGMKIAPDSKVDDGFLRIVVIEEMTKPIFISLAKDIYRGTHLKRKGIHIWKGRSVEVLSDEEVLIDMDGEFVGKVPMKVEILERSLRFIV